MPVCENYFIGNDDKRKWLRHILFLISDASEMARAKLKGLDNNIHVPPRKTDVNVNLNKNNQVKFPGGATTIPADQMKCNILKAAKMKEECQGLCLKSYSILLVWYNTEGC